jgi:hypothetical protein
VTGRRRGGGGGSTHTGTSTPSHHSTTSTPAHHSGADSPSTGHHTGGGGVGLEVDSIHTMAGRLESTRGRIEGVGNTVRGVSVGPESMGIVGTAFTGAAQEHLRTAEQHVARTTQAVDQAQRGTQGTVQAYRDTDAASATNLSSIDTTTTPPATHTPSGTTTHPAAGSSTTPSSAPAPPGAGGPPPPPHPPGGPPPPPHHPPGGGTTPPAGSTGGPPPPRNPWKALVRKNFNDKDYATFERAMDKMSRDPTPGNLPGSGALTQHEREIMARAQGLAQIRPDTMMHKSIPAADWPNYHSGTYDTVGGFVARSEDMTHLRTGDDIVQGQRLDYAGTKFHPGGDVYVIEFPAGNPSSYEVPFGSSYEPSVGQHPTDPNVVAARQDMENAAQAVGFTPAQIDGDVRQWPNTGAGVTGDPDLGVPEYTVHTADGTNRIPIPDGAKAYRYDSTGHPVELGTYDKSIGGWVWK